MARLIKKDGKQNSQEKNYFRDLIDWCYNNAFENISPFSYNLSSPLHKAPAKRHQEQRGFHCLYRPPLQIYKTTVEDDDFEKSQKNLTQEKPKKTYRSNSIPGLDCREANKVFQHHSDSEYSLVSYKDLTTYSRNRLRMTDRKQLDMSISAIFTQRLEELDTTKRPPSPKKTQNPVKNEATDKKQRTTKHPNQFALASNSKKRKHKSKDKSEQSEDEKFSGANDENFTDKSEDFNSTSKTENTTDINECIKASQLPREGQRKGFKMKFIPPREYKKKAKECILLDRHPINVINLGETSVLEMSSILLARGGTLIPINATKAFDLENVPVPDEHKAIPDIESSFPLVVKQLPQIREDVEVIHKTAPVRNIEDVNTWDFKYENPRLKHKMFRRFLKRRRDPLVAASKLITENENDEKKEVK